MKTDAKKVAIGFRLDPALLQDLRNRSHKTGMPVTLIIEDAVRFFFGEKNPATAKRREFLLN